MVRSLLRGVAWLLGTVVVLLAVWFGVNATDEPLSEGARAMRDLPPLPPPSRDNGFLDFLALGAPEGVATFEAGLERVGAFRNQHAGEVAAPPWGEFKVDKRVPYCAVGAASRNASGNLPCLEAVAAEPRMRDLLEEHRVLLRRYRAMREQPKFASPITLQTPDDAPPAYQVMFEGQRLVVLDAALRFNAGDREGALRELERDVAFYRLMAIQATTLIDKMVAFAMQDRIALLVVEFARRMPTGNAVHWRRLEALVRAPTLEELDVAPALRREYANTIRWMQSRRHVRLSDATYALSPEHFGTRPWWDPVAPYLYRPHQSVNHYAAICRIYVALADVPGTGLANAAQAADREARALDPGPIERVVLNPVGWRHPHLGCEGADYHARMHGRSGVQTLARLLVRLRAAGISRPDAVAAALAGPLGSEHANPFTGEPMKYDPKAGTIGFDVEKKYITGGGRHLIDGKGRFALPL